VSALLPVNTSVPSPDLATKKAGTSPHIDFLILSIVSAVVPRSEAKCEVMIKRDQGTLKRQVEKAVRSFAGKSAPSQRRRSGR
jgi:hypothetical protein